MIHACITICLTVVPLNIDERGDVESVRDFLVQARQLADQVHVGLHAAEFRNWAFRDIAIQQARAGAFDEAIKSVRMISEPFGWNPDDPVDALIGIAKAHVKAGNRRAAEDLFQEAVAALRDPPDWVGATYGITLAKIAEAQQMCGFENEATSTLALALQAVQDPNERRAPRVLAEIAEIQLRLQGSKVALATAQLIPEGKPEKAQVLLRVVRYFLARADIDEASSLARTMSVADSSSKCFALAEVAASQARADNPAAQQTLQEALQSAEAIKDGANRSRAFARLAMTQSQLGQEEAAAGMFAKAISAAYSIENVGVRFDTGCSLAIMENDRDRAWEYLVLALRKANKLEIEFHKSWAIEKIVCAQAECEFLADAIETIALLDRSEADWAWMAIAKAQGRASDWKAAIGSAHRISDNALGFKSSTLRKLAKSQAATGDWHGVLAWINSIKTPAVAMQPNEDPDFDESVKYLNEQMRFLAKCEALIGMAEGMLNRLMQND